MNTVEILHKLRKISCFLLKNVKMRRKSHFPLAYIPVISLLCVENENKENTASSDDDACAEPVDTASLPKPKKAAPVDDSPVIVMLPLNDGTEYPLTENLAAEYGVKHLPSDFKKREGYKRSIELSKKYGLYRQNYCGCIYSHNE